MPVDVISTLNDFRKDTLNREKDSMLLMTRRWKGVEDALMPQIDALARDIDALRAAGKDVTPGKLYRMDRYKALLAQVRNETAKYEAWSGRQIEQGQRDYFELGNAAARTMLKDLLPPGVNIDFNRIPIDAVNNMVGMCKDGSPLFDVLKKRALFPEAVDGLTTQLINAMALGWNPRKTARAMADGLAAGLNKALVIARTEQLRAYREATFQNYKANSDIVKGWVWHSACDTRTCAACWSMHGTVHALDERLDDHVCGRCAMIPVTKSWAELGYTGIPDTNPVIPSGEDVFSKLSEEKQRGILGNTRFQLWKDGTLDFSSLAKFTDDPTWGKSVQITPLKDMVIDINTQTVVNKQSNKINYLPEINYHPTMGGQRIPTETEYKIINNRILSMNPSIRALEPIDDIYRMARKLNGEYIALDDYVDIAILEYTSINGSAFSTGRGMYFLEEYIGTPVQDHEYIHTLTYRNIALRDALEEKYKPPKLFLHAKGASNIHSEQFTMIMTAYDDDKEKWINNLIDIGKYEYEEESTYEISKSQVDEIKRLLKGIGIWQ
jgi:SPP1 gp7 family putative phage head morphogenesis protein